MLLDNSLLQFSEITSDHFTNRIYKALFHEMQECYSTKGFADITILKSTDVMTITDIMNFVPSVKSFQHHKNYLVDLGVKRDLLKTLQDIQKIANENNVDAEALKSEALIRLNDVKLSMQTQKDTRISESVLRTLQALEDKSNQSSTKWGIKWLDEKTGGVSPGLTYLAARPSVGKTALALQIGKYVAKQGKKVAIFSLEMDETALTQRMIANAGNINKNKFKADAVLNEQDWTKISFTSGELYKLPIHIFDDKNYIEEIILHAEELRAKEGLDFLIIDYVQLVETRHKTNNTNERISYISRQIKKYQQQTKIHVLALSQFNRETEAKKFPTLANLRDSGSLEQDANNVFFLHEESQDFDQTEKEHKDLLLIIAKQREGDRNIYCNLKFFGGTQRFYEK